MSMFAKVLFAITFSVYASPSFAAETAVVSGIETRIGRDLDADETEQVEQLFARVNALESQERSLDESTYLGCLGGKIAAVFKRGYALCSDRRGNTYVLATTGMGGLGIKATGDVVVHSGPRDEIRGTYANGAPVSELADYYRYARLLAKFAQVNVDFFPKSDGSDSKLFFVGVDYGTYFDFGRDQLVLR